MNVFIRYIFDNSLWNHKAFFFFFNINNSVWINDKFSFDWHIRFEFKTWFENFVNQFYWFVQNIVNCNRAIFLWRFFIIHNQLNRWFSIHFSFVLRLKWFFSINDKTVFVSVIVFVIKNHIEIQFNQFRKWCDVVT